jgi:hypothetical protein
VLKDLFIEIDLIVYLKKIDILDVILIEEGLIQETEKLLGKKIVKGSAFKVFCLN